MPAKVGVLAGNGTPGAVLRVNSGVPALTGVSVLLALKLRSSADNGSCDAALRKSSTTERIGPPRVAAVKAPQADVMAVPLMLWSCWVTFAQAGTRRIRIASWGAGIAGAKSLTAFSAFKAEGSSAAAEGVLPGVPGAP